MSIVFNNDQFSVTPKGFEETELRRAEDEAHGCLPQVLLKEDFIHRKHAEFEELRGSFVEINRACTDEAYQAHSQGYGLERDNYGIEWRIWTGGIPTQEQMATTPWET